MPNMSALPVTSVPSKSGLLAPPGQTAESSHLERPGEVGYQQTVFPAKKDQMEKVIATLQSKGAGLTVGTSNLGIEDTYFALETVDTIATHILSLYGAKIGAFVKNEATLEIDLERETEDGAVFIHSSKPGISQTEGPNHERRIEEKYLNSTDTTKMYRLESYRSNADAASKFNLRSYFISKCNYAAPHPDESQKFDIRQVGDKTFLEKASENTLVLYTSVIQAVLERTGVVIEMLDIAGSREKRLIIGFRQRSTQHFFSAMSDLYHYYDLYSSRKYVEQFSNGVTIMCLYLNPMVNSSGPPIEHSIQQVIKEASLLYCLPTTPLQPLFQSGTLSVQEIMYGYTCWIFCQHFLNRLGSEYTSLVTALDANNATHQEVLTKMKKRLRQDTFTREYILDIIKQYPSLIKLLYVNFAMTHYIQPLGSGLNRPTLSYQRLQTDRVLTEEELKHEIKTTTSNMHEMMVFESFLTFNKHVLKTNFYQPTKVALSFRLAPGFLPSIEYPTSLFGMFLVVGNEFRGFHLRFRDVARGGIRIIRSRNREAYSINLRSLFDENYALAATQQKKNKDIPEGGSKGTILLDFALQDKPRVAFEKYVDAMLDLLITGQTPGIKEKIVDLYGKPEILFFGPDEGTADYMDWASAHARTRGASFWKAFTTGKSQSLGGIPHDLFGMTTRSVHQYVLGIYRKLGLKEEDCTKFQTGGPDGDLGSNEIRISKDKTIGIVDGSGVVFDPNGIDRAELTKLAENRQMVVQFDTKKLSPQGFRVLIEENNVKLPDGSIVENGLKFRNEFHLDRRNSATVFVPCGGRPEAVDLSNVQELLYADGTPRFKYIVEGANLFFTQEARLRLEKAGAVIFKDASANKGGVTSSSLEVLAALAFNDEEFAENMQVHNGKVSPFYSAYIKDVHNIIEHNAELEFECIWREHARTGTPRSVLTDQVSFAIVKLNEELQHNALWDNVALRKVVLEEAFPSMLLQKLGLETLLKRVPENYIRAIFGSYLASRFVYQYGHEPSQFAFLQFMTTYFAKMAAVQQQQKQ